jgi:aminoglycoside phosphotransferase (APT) family kinase protein
VAPGPESDVDTDAALRRALRDRPPPAALAWVSRSLGGAAVAGVEAIPGGSSSAMHRLRLRHGRSGDTVVLRRYVRAGIVNEEPGIAEHEARTLDLVAASAVATPTLLAVDADADHADVPALVMSDLPGRPAWYSRDTDRWVPALAEAAAAIHDLAVPSGTALPACAGYRQRSYDPPGWAGDPSVWDRAAALFHDRSRVPSETRFIHRDFHPGNVLWHRRQVTGVVDWQAACVGSPSIDVAHCRMNLCFDDPGLTEVLTRQWERVTGLVWDPWSDVIVIIGALDQLRRHPPRPVARQALEQALGRAVAET